MNAGKRAIFIMLAGIVAITASALVRGLTATIEVRQGTRIRHDDFAFTVRHVTRATGSTAQSLAVEILVENDAKRVDYAWSPTIVYLEDASGTRFKPDLGNSTPSLTLAAGQSATVTVRFALPKPASDLRLGFLDGVLMGDVFDFMRYARTRVRLFG